MCHFPPPAGLFVFGAAPTAAINGIAVGIAPPDAAHYASGVQFAAQNLAKLVVPSVGGLVIDRVGLLSGFNSVLVVTAGACARRGGGVAARVAKGGGCSEVVWFASFGGRFVRLPAPSSSSRVHIAVHQSNDDPKRSTRPFDLLLVASATSGCVRRTEEAGVIS
jgi:hypothetical protein